MDYFDNTLETEPVRTSLDAESWTGQFGFWEWDLRGERVIWLNDWCATLDLDPCPVDGHEYYWNQRRHALDRAMVEAAWLQHRDGLTEWFEAEYRVQTRGGAWRWIGERGKIVERDEDGEPVKMIGACFDIHQRRSVEAGLKRQQQFLETIAGSVPAWLVILDLDGRIEFANRPIGGVSPTHALGQRLPDLLAATNRRHIEAALAAVASTRTARNQSLVTDRHGNTRYFECRIAPVLTDGAVTQLAAIAVEVTERRQLERAVIEIARHEQERMSRDLHDGLGQELFGISLLLKGLSRRPGLDAGTINGLEEVMALTTTAMQTTRALATGLSPVVSGYAGLVSRLTLFIRRLSGCAPGALRCSLAERIRGEIDSPVADQLWRIGQEALTNAVRHSGATEIAVRLVEEEMELLLEVEDNGSGLRSMHSPAAGLGTRIMLYRADSIGAVLTFESRAGGGALVRCRLPLDRVEPL